MNSHHSITGLMRALECGFALGRLQDTVPDPYWAWIRQSQTSDTWEIEHGRSTASGFAKLMEDLIRHPWEWHIGLVTVTDATKGRFEVTIEDTLPWIIGERVNDNTNWMDRFSALVF
jgi:hypothetical protein